MKQSFPRALVVVLFALVLLLGGVAALMFIEVASPAAPYEHALDLRAVAQAAPTGAPVAATPAAAPSGAE